ncbi:hypothetical protein [Leeuwenhoekiella sp. UBA6783]|uniref:hypothetical protein n=1 Tax=Leeuwenhoekiella sp. UBA6783 TaxID=1946747 RepID=UPI0025C70B74|nr:hypothetical protein [Leeuwenhoekiella sp. UBA6783]|tara:strand:- start:24969 stop:25682 length:714 start_codon:yes stop_codon:yes gene_type:complete
MHYTLFFLFLYTGLCFVQKDYTFDYRLEYQQTFFKDSIPIKNRPFYTQDSIATVTYLTNSKDNSYHGVLTAPDSLHYLLNFKDENGLQFEVSFLKAEFDQAIAVKIPCEFVRSYRNAYTYQTKHYAFSRAQDTLIDGLQYQYYTLAANNLRKAKKKKTGTLLYIIAPETSFHLPLLTYATAFEEWKTNQNLPNGIFYRKYFIDYYDQKDTQWQLLSNQKIDLKLYIDAACDYTKEAN